MNTQTVIPALAIALEGRALIEASAGTGKTWTLTGIILRLLVEGGRQPRDIIATTFTRKAAAEMRQRVQKRLYALRETLKAVAVAYFADESLLHDDDGLGSRLGALLDKNGEADPINRHLLLNAVAGRGLDGLIDLFSRVEALQERLDELFIGTIDSLCQRWLAEYSLETGSDKHLEISQSDDALEETVHDQLRRIRHESQQHDPTAFAALSAQGKQHGSHDYLGAAREATNHRHADIDAGEAPAYNAAAHTALRQQTIAAADIAAWQALTAGDAFRAAVNANYKWHTKLGALPRLIAQLQQGQTLDDDSGKLADGFRQPKFKNGHEALAGAYHALPLTRHLSALLAAHEAWSAHLDYFARADTARLLAAVREHYPMTLAARGETTFSEKTARLNAVLAGEGGENLARYLTRRYPVMLVDESQDLNDEQATLLTHTYLRPKVPPAHSYLLLVGDPKQAIYAFRGGDVANYNRLKTCFTAEQQYRLDTNRRSDPNLIAALNEYYAVGENATLGENIAYQKAQAANPAPRIVYKNGNTPDRPLHWITCGNNQDEEAATIAALIANLLADTSPYARRKTDGSLSRIQPCDIQVLMRSNSSLTALQNALHHYHIDSEHNQQQSIYRGAVARAFADLLAAIEQPENRARQNRLLGGIYYQKTQQELDRLAAIEQGEQAAAADELTLADLCEALARARQDWENHGLLAALNPLLNHHKHNIWQTLAAVPAPENLRYLLDLRHLQHILAEQADQQRPAHLSQWWRAQLAVPPEADWAKAPPLPGKNAVRLYTIHKAKGLESPITILASGDTRNGVDKRCPVKTYRYHHDDRLRLQLKKPEGEQQKQYEQQEHHENARLRYVGLTRAQNLLIIVCRSNSPAATANLYNALGASLHSQVLASPDDLKHNRQPLPAPTSAMPPPAAPPTGDKPWRNRHYGWQRTSFSALLRENIATPPAVDLADYAVAESERIPDAPLDADIRYTYPRGPGPGSALHAILEHSRADNRYQWRHNLTRENRRYRLGLTGEQQQACQSWLDDIHQSRLPQSGITLAASKNGEHRSEYGFTLGSDDRAALDTDAINHLMQDHGYPLHLRHSPHHYRYIRGEIDHIYQHQGRYYILDYKTNHLGNHPDDYRRDNLIAAMNDHHYWLQAALYQIALHRLLKNRLPGYHPGQHLGGIEYLYLRGIHPDHPDHGKLGWNYPAALIEQLDHHIGYSHT